MVYITEAPSIKAFTSVREGNVANIIKKRKLKVIGNL